jgi:two-component system cell cycle sensor histidine kinase/response regulator CckA
MLRRTVGEHIDLVTKLSPDGCLVNADRGQLEQVIVNLAINARDAMPGGGILDIRTDNVNFDEVSSYDQFEILPGSYVCLTVADTGVGMPKEVVAQAFDPFFTTKPKGRGTGLGLATVYGTVKQSGGYIDIHSELGVGTTAKVYLAATGKQVFAPSEPNRDDDLDGKGETILVVEDVDAVRALTERILSQHGYEVVKANGGEAALRICEEHGQPIDLLLTDVVMPHMSGRELTARIKALQPGVKTLYMSGYTDDVISSGGTLEEGVHLVEKPFDPITLLKKVRIVLDGRNGGSLPEPEVGDEDGRGAGPVVANPN